MRSYLSVVSLGALVSAIEDYGDSQGNTFSGFEPAQMPWPQPKEQESSSYLELGQAPPAPSQQGYSQHGAQGSSHMYSSASPYDQPTPSIPARGGYGQEPANGGYGQSSNINGWSTPTPNNGGYGQSSNTNGWSDPAPINGGYGQSSITNG